MSSIIRSVVLITLLGGAFALVRMSGDHSPAAQAPSVGALKGSAALEQPVETESRRAVGSAPKTPPREARQHVRTPAPATGEVHVSGDRLSLDVTDKPLRAVLDEVYQKTGIAFVLADEIPNPPVSVQLSDLPIEEGLRRLLESHDSFFLFSSVGGSSSGLTSVWVYPQGKGQGLAPIPSPFEPRTDELEQEAEDPNVLKRAWATATLIERNGNEALEVAKTALADPEESVRMRVLHAVLNASVELSPDTLMDIAQYDPAPTLRAMALAALTDSDRAHAIEKADVWKLLNAARNDPDPAVSGLANQVLDTWTSASEPQEEEGAQKVPQGELPEGEAGG